MNFTNFFKSETWKTAFQGFGMKVNAARPEIMLVSGALSVLAGTIYACTKTEKAKTVVEDTKKQAMEVEEKLQIDVPEGVDILPETKKQLKVERGRQFLKIYALAVYEMVKIYGVPALLWLGGMGMIVGGHGELRKLNRGLAADILAGNQLLQEYRERVAKAVGEEAENKIFMGAQEGMITVVDTDPETGEKNVRQEKADVFYAQPGSIFARNFTEENTDIMWRQFTDELLDARVKEINDKLEIGFMRAYNGLDILRILGFNENALGEGESMDKLLSYGISGNARKVPDPEMRKLKITRLRGYQEKWDVAHQCKVYEPCLRIDFNFYPLEGKI